MTDEDRKLRSHAAWARSMRNFEWLLDSVSGAMDVDCMIERNGHFLIIEGKPWSGGVRMPYGQHKALYALSKQPNTRVYLVGEDGEDIHVALYNEAPKPVYIRTGSVAFWPPERFVPTTKEGLSKMVQAWWRTADEAA